MTQTDCVRNTIQNVYLLINCYQRHEIIGNQSYPSTGDLSLKFYYTVYNATSIDTFVCLRSESSLIPNFLPKIFSVRLRYGTYK